MKKYNEFINEALNIDEYSQVIDDLTSFWEKMEYSIKEVQKFNAGSKKPVDTVKKPRKPVATPAEDSKTKTKTKEPDPAPAVPTAGEEKSGTVELKPEVEKIPVTVGVG